MDIRIEKKKGIRALFTKKGIPYPGRGAVPRLRVVAPVARQLLDAARRCPYDFRRQVVRGEFNDYIRVTGQVQPITTVQLSPSKRARRRLVVEEGTSVKRAMCWSC